MPFVCTLLALTARRPLARPAQPIISAAPPVTSSPAWLSVLDFGASPNTTDNTAAFNAALAEAAKQGGTTVLAPAGTYHFKGSLQIAPGVTLVGSYSSVPSHDLRGPTKVPDDGTVLVPTGGRGSEAGTAFVTVHANAVLARVCIWYAEQERTALPVAYPWTVMLDGANAAVTDVYAAAPSPDALAVCVR